MKPVYMFIREAACLDAGFSPANQSTIKGFKKRSDWLKISGQ